MEQREVYRHELKYQIGQSDYLAIRQRLRAVMKPDAHAIQDGKYTVRSLYFDNFDDKALREKLDGCPKREKFRIRYYNDDFGFITLEKKLKNNDLCIKFDAQLSEEEYRAILSGPVDWMMRHPSPLVRELYCKILAQQLRPRVMVSYVREPYVYTAGNVRVTFDSCIRSSLFSQDFSGTDIKDIDSAEHSGDVILEVKYDGFLPDIIQALLQTGSIRQQAFSKYGACRKFG